MNIKKITYKLKKFIRYKYLPCPLLPVPLTISQLSGINVREKKEGLFINKSLIKIRFIADIRRKCFSKKNFF